MMNHLDLRGLISAFALLKASNAFKELKAGETLEILGSGSETSTELLKVLPSASYEIVVMETAENGARQFRIQLKKK